MKNFLSIESLMNKIKTLGGGEFHTLTFVSNPKMKKGFAQISKVSKVQIRTKLNYENTKRYQEYLEQRGYIGERNENVTYVLDKALKHNNKTNNDLFVIVPKYETWVSHYEDENGNEVSKEEVEKMTYKKSKSDSLPYVMTINARQVISLV